MELTAMYLYLGSNKGLHPLDPRNIDGGEYDYRAVDDEVEMEELLAEGWRHTTKAAKAYVAELAEPVKAEEVIIAHAVEDIPRPRGHPRKEQ